ncbi:MAG TPA: YrhK family protein [Candidatus Dietzia intestinigallinarum]|nr:YrhK family protein [Candidatus Dietzia intestinigallinarum]
MSEPHLARIPLGPEVLVIRDRYETLSIANDVLIGIWFVVGSVLFFSEATTTAATALFVVGSVQMLIRPVIRLSRRLHLRRRGYSDSGSGQDF